MSRVSLSKSPLLHALATRNKDQRIPKAGDAIRWYLDDHRGKRWNIGVVLSFSKRQPGSLVVRTLTGLTEIHAAYAQIIEPDDPNYPVCRYHFMRCGHLAKWDTEAGFLCGVHGGNPHRKTRRRLVLDPATGIIKGIESNEPTKNS